MSIPFSVKSGGAWTNLQDMYRLGVTELSTSGTFISLGGRRCLRLRLPTGRWAVYYERDWVDHYGGVSATIFSLPDEGVTEKPLYLRHHGGWIHAGTLATGGAVFTAFLAGILAEDAPTTSGLAAPDINTWGGLPVGDPPAPYVLPAGAGSPGVIGEFVNWQAWIAIDLGFLQDSGGGFYDGYIQFPVSGYTTDGHGSGLLYRSTATPSVSGTFTLASDYNHPQQTYMLDSRLACWVDTDLSAETPGAGTLLHSWALADLDSDPVFLTQAAAFDATAYRYSFSNADVLARAVLVFRVEVDLPSDSAHWHQMFCRPRVVLRG